MIAGFVKQDQNTQKVHTQQQQNTKKRYLLRQNKTSKYSR